MGQKANPNSIHLTKTAILRFGGCFYNTVEYSTLFRDYSQIISNLAVLFEQHGCFVKKTVLFLKPEKKSLILFLSFLIWKRKRKRRLPDKRKGNNFLRSEIQKKKFSVDIAKRAPYWRPKVQAGIAVASSKANKRLQSVRKLSQHKNSNKVFKVREKRKKKGVLVLRNKVFTALEMLGYKNFSKRLVFINLSKQVSRYKKLAFYKREFILTQSLWRYKRQLYFFPGLAVFVLLHFSYDNAQMLAKFIAFFFKRFHKKKHVSKLLFFLRELLQNLAYSGKPEDRMASADFIRLSGLKIQIKGRFNRVSRTQKRLFTFGELPLQTVKTRIDYALIHVATTYGIFGIKVWIAP